GLPVRRYGVHEGQQVGDAHIVYSGRIEVRRVGDAGQRGVTAVAASINGDAGRVGDALVNQPLHAVGDVVLHAQTPLAETGFPEFPSVAGRPAIVHLQHAIAAVGQKLGLGIETPAVTHPGPTMRVHDAGQLAGVATYGQSQVTVNNQAIARLVLYGMHRRHVGFGQGGVDVGQSVQGVVDRVVKVAGAGRAVVVGGHNEFGFVFCATLQRHLITGQLRFQARLTSGTDFIEKVIHRLVCLVSRYGQYLAQPRVAGGVQVVAIGAEHKLLRVWLGRIYLDQGKTIAAAIA